MAASFYPASAVELSCTVELLLAEASAADCPRPKALIAPHAGYAYSGAVAAAAYASLRGERGTIERVVVLGPAHYVDVKGIATSNASAFTTPMGELLLDRDAIDAIARLPGVAALDNAHAPEHSVEVQIPFVQAALGQVRLVPLLCGSGTCEKQLDRVLDVLWGGEETLFVVSSDLSHYLDYDSARARDAATTRSIESLDADAIGSDDACGPSCLRAILRAASKRRMHAKVLDVKSSGDTVGGRDEVVGYGAYAVW
ncbi:MAG TPA: AmmeMemoRadiSam system protein B [Labilithrix sp.]